MNRLSNSIQIVSLISIAVFVGVMTCVYTSQYSIWVGLSPKDFLQTYQIFSGGIMDSTGTTGMASLLFPLCAVVITWKRKQSRIYWLLTLTLVVIIIAITMAYFAKVNSTFANQTISLTDIPETLETWGSLHIVRIVIGILSAFSAGMGLIKFNAAD